MSYAENKSLLVTAHVGCGPRRKAHHEDNKNAKDSRRKTAFVLFFVCFVPSWLSFFLPFLRKEERIFFSEEKKQKTFMSWCWGNGIAY
jgi:hypothetical protein